MSVLLKETQGDTLVGVIDGHNTDYSVNYDYLAESVNIFVNGLLIRRDWDDGFDVIPPRSLRMKQALRVGDTLEVEYKTEIRTGGGAGGGCPSPPQAIEYFPNLQAEIKDLSSIFSGGSVKPGVALGQESIPQVSIRDLHPVLVGSEEEE